MLITSIVGARPNFMKMAPVIRALSTLPVQQCLVHTGQHYDANMSRVFFEQLAMPEPSIYLGVGSGSHASQTARIMTGLEDLFKRVRPDLVIVAGDVNSTLAAALVAAKEHVPVAHVEAGLRSFDRSMPEEINRIVVDHLSDVLFTSEESGGTNLVQEGICEDQIHFVGNCMVDSLLQHVEAAVASAPWEGFGLEPGGYGLVTLHRPSNVDDLPTLRRILSILEAVSERLPLLFPIHPRSRSKLASGGLKLPASLHLSDPLPYLSFVGLMARSRCVLTDSGGIQEETTVLDVPCLTMRSNTERPITVECGSNRIVGTDPSVILESVDAILADQWIHAGRPPLWDGAAAERIASVVELMLS